ncbi:MAG: hypothetical protein ACPGO3_10790 [Magnetospiraceae bacterium]
MSIGLSPEITNPVLRDTVRDHFRAQGIHLPTFAELADPVANMTGFQAGMAGVDPDVVDARNLLRVHWHNDAARTGLVDVPDHVVLPRELTGVPAKIIVALGDRFPMIAAHKVLPAYACLVVRLVTGAFDPNQHRAVWPSTGNYCRGGVAISRILGCRGVAVLPEGMSEERFHWLENWVADPADIIRTPGTESNVKEIYDACHRLAEDPRNVILNQFSEFANYIAHRSVTGAALGRVFDAVAGESCLRLKGFISASGSAGTLAAGDYLKQRYGSVIAAVEALECPTLLYNGYGEHNIQGIGDKHVPLIHNVMNTDFAIGVPDAASDTLNLVFNTPEGQRYLTERKNVDPAVVAQLGDLGLSAIANVVAAVKLAKYLDLGAEDALITVATDGAAMYMTEQEKARAKYLSGPFDAMAAAECFSRYMLGAVTDHTQELSRRDRERIFSLGYYTWVEQQGISLADFDRRRDQAFWDGLVAALPAWDGLIDAFNGA